MAANEDGTATTSSTLLATRGQRLRRRLWAWPTRTGATPEGQGSRVATPGLLVACLGLIVVHFAATVGLLSSMATTDRYREQLREAELVDSDLLRLSGDLGTFGAGVQEGIAAMERGEATATTGRTEAVAAVNALRQRWDQSVREMGRLGEVPERATEIEAAMTRVFVTDAVALTELADGPSPDLTAVFEEFDRWGRDVGSLGTEVLALVADRRVQHEAADSELADATTRGRLLLGVMLGLSAAGLLMIGLMMRAVNQRQRRLDGEIEERRTESARHRFEVRLQAGLEMASGEAEAYRVVRRALEQTAEGVRVDVLLSDSSGSHLDRVVGLERDDVPPCSVSTPRDCPAVRQGHRLTFQSGEQIDACPHLADRAGGPHQAVCLPMNIGGTASGVLHIAARRDDTVEPATIASLEVVARATSDRLAMLRAFDRSQTQAATDPLTGLLNRRSFEDRAGGLMTAGSPFTMVFADLDHFKDLNDRFGHATGDRALRTFARVLAEESRPGDLVCRHGGEEFLLLLDRCTIESALQVIDRIRAQASLATTAAGLPAVTASFGLTWRDDDASLDELVARADRALLAAKEGGRNTERIIDRSGEVRARSDAADGSDPVDPVEPVDVASSVATGGIGPSGVPALDDRSGDSAPALVWP